MFSLTDFSGYLDSVPDPDLRPEERRSGMGQWQSRQVTAGMH